MRLSVQMQPNLKVFDILGDIDIGSCKALQEQYQQTLTSPGDTIIRLNKVNYIDSSGIAVLIQMVNDLHEKGGDVFLAGASPAVKKIFAVAGLSRYFHFLDEAELAERLKS